MHVEPEIPRSCICQVFLHGPLEVWLRTADGTWVLVEKDAWGTGRAARSVFKRLLAAPGQRLSRGSIQDDLWPEMEPFEVVERMLYNAINQIRRVIGKPLVTTFESTYRLADQTQIWVDLDACERLLREAENIGGASAQAIPLLEQTLTLLERGEMLEGESGTWVYGWRRKSEEMLRQCHRWLAQGYEAQGKVYQAGEQYRALVSLLPPDEEALQRWMLLLQRSGRSQEALQCYQEVQETVTTEGWSLSKTTAMVAAAIAHERQSLARSLEHIGLTLTDILRATPQEDSPMNILLRRQFLHRMLAVPFSLLLQEPPIGDDEAYLVQCQEHISTCWRLLHGTEIRTAQVLLCFWLPPLEHMLLKPSPSHSRAAHLAAQGYLLAGLIAILQRQNDAAEWCRRQAVAYAEMTDDLHLKVAALKHLATHYDDLCCFLMTRRVYEQALPLIADTTPLLRSRIELGLALAEARLGEQQKALSYWERAQEHFPAYSEERDPAFSYADCGKASLNHYGGLMYLELHNPEQAWENFDALATLALPIPQRTSNEILLCKTQAALALNDLDRTTTHLQEGIEGALDLKSAMRLHTAFKLYQQACTRWPNEHALSVLQELFHTAGLEC